MLFSRDQLLELSEQAGGELATLPFPALLLAHAVEERSVELRLRRGHVDKRIFLEAGVPVDCRSNLLHETIGRFLVQQGRLTEEGYQESFRDSVARGLLIGEVLVERKLLDPSELFKALQQCLAKKLLDVFTWREGRFEVVRQPPATGSSLKVKVPQLLLTGISRFSPPEAIERWSAELGERPLARSATPFFALGDLRFTPAQARLLELLERQPLPLAGLAETLGATPDETARCVCVLSLLGALAPVPRVPEAPPAMGTTPAVSPAPYAPQAPQAPVAEPAPAAVLPPSPPSVPTAPPTPPAPTPAPRAARAAAVSPEESARLANALTEAYLAHRRQDAFDLLGVSEDAPLAFVQYQYLNFARRFAPWKYESGELASLADQARELFLAGALAFAELERAESRDALRFRRSQEREAAARQKSASYFKIQTDLLDPETQFAKGIALRDAGRFKAAIQQLEFAVDCDPGNSLYLAELAWTRFCESPEAAARSLADLREAMRLDPQAGLPCYYAGEVAAATGDRAQAESLLRRSIKPMAPDRRPLEALRRLATERKR